MPPEDRHAWLEICDQALTAAHRRGATDQVAEIALLVAVRLDSAGRLDEALARLEVARALTAPGTPAHLHLECARACLLALGGAVSEAESGLQTVASHLHASQPPRTHLEFAVYRALVACLALREEPIAALAAPVTRAAEAGFDWLASGLIAWLVPWLGATGRPSSARAWTDSLRAQATARRHTSRLADARAFGFVLDTAEDPAGGAELPSGLRGNGAWRANVARLRIEVLHGRWDRAAEETRELELLVQGMNPGFAAGVEGFAALVAAYRLGRLEGGPRPPPAPTLVNLPALLAGAEAVAIGGTQAECAAWARWLADQLPAHVVTSLEWPVAVGRLRALLHARLGELAVARTLLERAWTGAGARDIEASLGRLQWAEIETQAWRRGRRGAARGAFREAAEALLARGIDPVPHAYAATRTAPRRAERPPQSLSPREIEVLQLLAEGLTYREVARRLDLSWRTVQTHASRIYEKLDVPGRTLAIAAARALGVL